ncbi:MAG: hypothetical protein J6Q69_07280 [Clostridia bacterium]|nr:hypothetical protein [Clostridia bacterium]
MELYFKEIYGKLPPRLLLEMKHVCIGRKRELREISEIRLHTGGATVIRLSGERIRLPFVLSKIEAEALVKRFCDGSIYAHKSTIADGYISVGGGVRIGISGVARYDGGKMVGVCDVASLVVRIPTVTSSLADELYSAYRECKRGLIIYSRAGVGKTTALRTLLPMIGGGGLGECVAVVDERCEISGALCAEAGVAYLGGYKRREGLEIALRTLSAEVIAVDELGSSEEAILMRASLMSGVKFVATAHAGAHEELVLRDGIRPLCEAGVFDVSFGIFNTDAGYSCRVERILC